MSIKQSLILNCIFAALFSIFLFYLLIKGHIHWLFFVVTLIYFALVSYLEWIRKERKLLETTSPQHPETLKRLNQEARGLIIVNAIFILIYGLMIIFKQHEATLAFPIIIVGIMSLIKGFALSTELYRRRENLPKRK